MRRYKIRENAFILMFESLFYKHTDISPSEDNALNTTNTTDEILNLAKECDAVEITPEVENLFCGAYEKRSGIDEMISRNLNKKWNINRISKISLSILRIALYEILYEKRHEDSLVINEAIELAKEYSEAEDASFINGVLGSVCRISSNADTDRKLHDGKDL